MFVTYPQFPNTNERLELYTQAGACQLDILAASSLTPTPENLVIHVTDFLTKWLIH